MKTNKKRLLSAEDLCKLNILAGVAISPDESKIAYTVETISDDHKKYFSHIYMADIRTGKSRQFTFGEIHDGAPVWSPDGKSIAFISSRNKKTGIYIMPAEGGGEKKIIEEDGVFMGLVWTPDCKSLIYAFRYNDSHTEKDEKKKREAPVFRHITRLFYRLDGSGFMPKDRFHIWKLDITEGTQKQITRGKHDEVHPSVSPDGRWIAFVSNHSKDPDLDANREDLFIVSSNGGRERMIPTPAGPKGVPTFSPDGRKIAYLAHTNPDDTGGVANLHIWMVGLNGKPAAKDLVPKFDRQCVDQSIGDMGEGHGLPSLYWSPDGRKIYFVGSDTGNTHLFYVPSKGGLPTRITKRNCHIKAYSLNGKKKMLAAVISELNNPGDLYLMPPVYGGDRRLKKLTSLNQKLFSEIKFPATRERWFRAHDGTPLQGWLVTPPNFKPGRKYPAILEIHGGPRVQYGFTFFHEMNLLASKGYVVFYANPRGGGGRGETWADSITENWGEIDYRDCMAAADYMERLPFVNRNRIGVTGGSYGGYMTNWIVGHTNRFKAAVTQRSVVNLESFVGSSDLGFMDKREFGGYPWSNPEGYRKMSPLTYAKNVRTPLLILHNEGDLRCGIEQAEELFATLKVMKKKAEFVRFPEEPHGLSRHGRPDRRIARLQWILKWFERYL